MRRGVALSLLGCAALAGCGGSGDRPAPRSAASIAPHVGSAPRRPETPPALVCLRQARLNDARQSQSGVWQAIAANGQFVVVQRRHGRYRVRGGVAEEDAGRAVGAVRACLRALG